MTPGRIIAFSGAHGTGKTTAVYDLACRLKRERAADFGLILETARRCPYPVLSGSHRPDISAQVWIFCEQIKCELDAAARYGLTISDRAAVDAAAYSAACGYSALAWAQMQVLKTHAPIYDTVYFMALADHDHLIDDGFRSLIDPALRSRVETNLLEMYAELGIQVKKWES